VKIDVGGSDRVVVEIGDDEQVRIYTKPLLLIASHAFDGISNIVAIEMTP